MSNLSIDPQPSSSVPASGLLSPEVKLQPANPFFDNIRQNLELSHGGITERIPLKLASEVVNRVYELPSWLADLVNLTDKECSDRLAEQFYGLELGEQKRLQGVMDFHSKGSGASWTETPQQDANERRQAWYEERAEDAAEVARCADGGVGTVPLKDHYFPFSITAGVERGSKNRLVASGLVTV